VKCGQSLPDTWWKMEATAQDRTGLREVVCVAVDPLEVTSHKHSMYHSVAVSFHGPLRFIIVTTNYSVSTRAVL